MGDVEACGAFPNTVPDANWSVLEEVGDAKACWQLDMVACRITDT